MNQPCRRWPRWLVSFWFLFFLGAVHAAGDPVLKVEIGAHNAPIRQLAVDSNEKWAVTVSDDKTARVWNLESGNPHAVLRVPIGAAKLGSLYAAAISPQNDVVAVAGTTGSGQTAHRIYLFGLETGSLDTVINAHAGDIKHLVWTPDGKLLVASYAGAHGVRFFDRQGRLLKEESFAGPSYGAAVSPQGKVAVAAFDGSIHFWAVGAKGIEPAGRIALPIPDPVSVSFSPDGSQLAVGYHARNARNQVQVDVLDLQKMQVGRSFSFGDIDYGNLMQVAWSRDGSKIYAAGTGYRQPTRFLLKTIEWPTGQASELTVAGNSITRLVALPKGGVGFSTFEPSWGTVRDGRLTTRRLSVMTGVKDAASLKINPDGSLLSWRPAGDSSALTFDLKTRRSMPAPPSGLLDTAVSAFMHFRISDWENTRNPRVNGVAVALAPEEVSRAVAVLPDHSAALLGTSWTLRKFDSAGRELWRLPVETEVKALNVTQDSRTIVMAQVDGRVSWLRASDGALLLTLIMTSDGRWVLVDPSGYFDASASAEGLLGWQIDRPEGWTSDFFSVAKFRDRFYRPDVIDKSLRFTSPEDALARADEEASLAQAAPFGLEGTRNPASHGALPLQRQLPPVVTLAGAGVADAGDGKLKIDFAVFSQTDAPVERWQVMVNGRPAQSFVLKMPAHADGKALGQVELAQPAADASIQLVASNRFGFSEALAVDVQGLRKTTGTAPPQDRRPDLYVLSIGVAQYANSALNLLFPAKDARDLVEMLKQQKGVQYENVFHRTLTDKEAGRQAIGKGLQWLRDAATEKDVAMVFIAGHGVTLAGNAYRFLPHDADFSKPDETLVTEDQIRDALVNIKGKAILFIDTCFSGKAIGRFTKHDTKLIANRLSSAESGVIVFSSSDGRQESLEKEDWRNGAFTKELLAGLKGDADFRQEGVVTHKGLDYFVSHQVKQLTNGLQTPVTTVPIGISDYTLTRHAKPAAPRMTVDR